MYGAAVDVTAPSNVLAPKAEHIYWTAWSPAEGDSSPVDPLRFETYAERLGNHLVPGVSNRVQRVRYFSMVCAGIKAAADDVGTTTSGREHTRRVRARFTRYEAAWAFAQVAALGRDIKELPEGSHQPRLRDEFRGFRGANRALSFWQRTIDHTHVNARRDYRLLQAQEAQGGLGAYLVSLRSYGFVHPDRLDVTAAGNQLAAAFLSSCQADVRQALSVDGRPARAVWSKAGHKLLLSAPSAAERELVAQALFGNLKRPLSRLVHDIPSSLRQREATEDAFHHIAASDSQLAPAASYALDFDRLRLASLRMFAAVGASLIARAAPTKLAVLLDPAELSALATDVRAAAAAVAGRTPPPGLAPVAVLAQKLCRAQPAKEAFADLIWFHRSEGRRWIEQAGPHTYRTVMPGTFQDPGARFHGFTLNAALSVYEDTQL